LTAEATTVSNLRVSAQRWRRERLKELRSFKLCKKQHRFPELSEVLIRLLFFAALAIAVVQQVKHIDIQAEYYAILFSLAGVFVIRLTLQIIVFARTQKRLGEKRLIPILLLWDLLFPCIYIVLVIKSIFPAKKIRNRGIWH
jgi:hypothetical protein